MEMPDSRGAEPKVARRRVVDEPGEETPSLESAAGRPGGESAFQESLRSIKVSKLPHVALSLTTYREGRRGQVPWRRA